MLAKRSEGTLVRFHEIEALRSVYNFAFNCLMEMIDGVVMLSDCAEIGSVTGVDDHTGRTVGYDEPRAACTEKLVDTLHDLVLVRAT
jgi:hypothetical protein